MENHVSYVPMRHNLHLSNALTTLYLATGQDAACVAENAAGFSEAAVATAVEGLTFRVSLPSLTVACCKVGLAQAALSSRFCCAVFPPLRRTSSF